MKKIKLYLKEYNETRFINESEFISIVFDNLLTEREKIFYETTKEFDLDAAITVVKSCGDYFCIEGIV